VHLFFSRVRDYGLYVYKKHDKVDADEAVMKKDCSDELGSNAAQVDFLRSLYPESRRIDGGKSYR